MTADTNDTTRDAPPETVEEFANRFSASQGWQVSPSLLADALRPYLAAIAQAAHREALTDAAALMDSLMATYYVNEGRSADERDASTAIRQMLIATQPGGGSREVVEHHE
jgi:dsRNA-specific ribonuclease